MEWIRVESRVRQDWLGVDLMAGWLVGGWFPVKMGVDLWHCLCFIGRASSSRQEWIHSYRAAGTLLGVAEGLCMPSPSSP